MSAPKGTILFVHGMCHGNWCWEEAFIPYFKSKGYQCHALTLEGHVEANEHSIGHIRLEDFDKNIKEAVDALEQPPILVGHSMGGMVVQRFLRSGRCKQAVLMAPVPPKGVMAASIRIILKYPRSIQYLLQGDLLGFTRTFDFLFFGGNISEKQRANFRKKLCSESFMAYLQLLIPLRMTDFSGRMLVIGGMEDKIFTVKEMEQTAKKWGADLDLITGASHDLMLDPKSEEVAAIIHQWLQK